VALVIEPLDARHDRRAFSCGEAELDDWFAHRSGQDVRRNIARVFVAIDSELGVVGFYSLSSFSLALGEFPDALARKLPRYDAVPAALIGRLARDEKARGQRLGDFLVADAVRRILGANRSVAVFAIVVDAKNTKAAEFYKQFGFQSFPLHPERLFLTTATAIAALQKA
jgi:GNAT superfamily N-acetyltransferase